MKFRTFKPYIPAVALAMICGCDSQSRLEFALKEAKHNRQALKSIPNHIHPT